MFVSWLAFDNNKIIGTSGMSFVERSPFFSCPNGRLGILSIMYINTDYRRCGIDTELLNRVIEEARIFGCDRVQITASDMGGKSLYYLRIYTQWQLYAVQIMKLSIN